MKDIGLECAGFLNGLGFDSTVMVRSVALRGFDQQMAGFITAEMASKGVHFIQKSIPLGIEKQPDGRLKVRWTNLETNSVADDTYDTVLMAVGRRALTKELNVSAAGIITEPESGKIRVKDEQTNIPNIYAVGDVLHVRYLRTLVTELLIKLTTFFLCCKLSYAVKAVEITIKEDLSENK
jgi:thioredoxin reductase (NADPH)